MTPAYQVRSAALSPDPDPRIRPEQGGTAVLQPIAYNGRRYFFKEYNPDYRTEVDWDGLAALMAWRRELPAEDRSTLDAYAAWPRFMVLDEASDLVGLLSPRAHRAYYADQSSAEWKPRVLEMLLPATAGLPVGTGRTPLEIKLRTFGRLIEVVLWFHDRGVLINDLQPQNVLFSQFGDSVHLVDCDSMRSGRWAPVGPVVAPDDVWDQVPHLKKPAPATDMARLSWIAVQTLLEDEVLKIGREHAEKLADLLTPRVAAVLLESCQSGGDQTVDSAEWRQVSQSWLSDGDTPTMAAARVPRPRRDPDPPPEPSRPWYQSQAQQPWSPGTSSLREPEPFGPVPGELSLDLPDTDRPAEEPEPTSDRTVLVLFGLIVLVTSIAVYLGV